jgi:hypothetical protein
MGDVRKIHIPHIREFIEKYNRNLKEHIDRLSFDRSSRSSDISQEEILGTSLK